MPHPIDVMVGKRVRVRRLQVGISQTALGDKLGVTFQQIQKYERGANRVSCSRLYEIADALNVPITYFFSESPGQTTKLLDQVSPDRMKDGLRLINAFQQIGDDETRHRLVALTESMARSTPAKGKRARA